MALRPLFQRVTPSAWSVTTGRVFNTHSEPKPMGVKTVIALAQSIYLKQGIPNAFHASKVGRDRIWLRVDMPGVSPERLDINVQNNRVHFTGSEDPEKMHGIHLNRQENMPRTYSGVFTVDPTRFRAQDHVSRLVNGVLYLLFPCFIPEPAISRYNPNDPFALELSGYNKWKKNEAMYNPFVTKGEDRPFTFDCKDNVFVLVVDVPGVSSGNHTLTVEGSKISFRAEANLHDLDPFQIKVEPKSMRVYEGSFEIDLEAYETENAKAVIEFGVLWIEVPRRFRQPTIPGSSNLFSKGRIRLHLDKVCLELHA